MGICPLAMVFADGVRANRRRPAPGTSADKGKDGRHVPTGVAIRDPRRQLFDAAERVLLRDGPAALTSRAVTDEAGVAKGVLHRHFTDFEAFLAELVLDGIAQVNAQAAALRATAGTGSVAGNLAAALPDLFTPLLLALARLVFARDELRGRLRAATGSRIPLVSESVALAARYLEAERDLGRIAPGADIATLAPMLVSAAQLLFTDTDGPPTGSAVTRIVAAALAAADTALPRHVSGAWDDRSRSTGTLGGKCQAGPPGTVLAGRVDQLAESHPPEEGLACRIGCLADDLDAGMGVVDDAAKWLGPVRKGQDPGDLVGHRGGVGVFVGPEQAAGGFLVAGDERVEPRVGAGDVLVAGMAGVGEVLSPSGEGAGHDDRGLDAELADLVGGGDRERVHGGLGDDVRAEERRDGDRGGAADPQQGAAALLAHGRQRRPADALRAEDVDVEQPGDLLGGERLGVAGVQVAGVLHDDVELPGLADDLAD